MQTFLSADPTEHFKMARKRIILGQVVGIRRPLIIAQIPQASLGDLCIITRRDSSHLSAQVIGFQESLVSLAPFGELEGLSPGDVIENTESVPKIEVGYHYLGKIVDAFGKPLVRSSLSHYKGKSSHLEPIIKPPPRALDRVPISEQLVTGIRSLDTLCPLGVGQRIGLFANAGTGKSTLLARLARQASVDVSVIALIGERGREVNDFLKDAFTAESLERTVIVVATSDEAAIRRQLAAYTATTIAEFFRNQGLKTLLMLDSLTRFARAVREVGLASGELPVRQGYTNSVYAQLPCLLERAGNTQQGTLSAIYTVLTAGFQESDPLGEEIRSLLDGHVLLTEQMMHMGIRPAIDPLQSISRLASRLQITQQTQCVQQVLAILNRIQKDKELLLLGGTPDAQLSAALGVEEKLLKFLHQPLEEVTDIQTSWARLQEVVEEFESLKSRFQPAAC